VKTKKAKATSALIRIFRELSGIAVKIKINPKYWENLYNIIIFHL